MTMMVRAYLDCSGGITAKMVLGALLDAGLPLEMLEREIAKLHAGRFTLESGKVVKAGMPCTKIGIHFGAERRRRSYREISEMIKSSSLNRRIVGVAMRVFEVLAKAEAKVHGCTPSEAHFHEIGSLQNVAAVCASVAFLPRPLAASPLPMGSGTTRCSHGTIRLPAPATLEIIRGANLQTHSPNVKGELVTPTGAALVAVLATRQSSSPPGQEPKKIGIGAGDEELPVPNALRLHVFDKAFR